MAIGAIRRKISSKLDDIRDAFGGVADRVGSELQLGRIIARNVGSDLQRGFQNIPNNVRFLREDPKGFAEASRQKIERSSAYSPRIKPFTDFGIQQATNITRGIGGVQDLTRKDATGFDRAGGLLSIAGSVYGASPFGAIHNYAESTAAGNIKNLREGKGFDTSGAAEDLLISEGLGIENPALALGTNLLVGGITDPQSFRSLTKGRGIKNASNTYELANDALKQHIGRLETRVRQLENSGGSRSAINKTVREIDRAYKEIAQNRIKARKLGLNAGLVGELPEQANRFRDVEFRYVRNPEKAPNFGSEFGQNIEPAGKYMNLKSQEDTFVPEGWEQGTIKFKNPLVIDWGGDYRSGRNWKDVLSQQYGGKTGANLSKAIAQDGYDGIITLDKGTPSEVVSLASFNPKPPRQDLSGIGMGFVEDKKYSFNINKDRLNTTKAGRETIDKAVEAIRPTLETNKGKPLTNKEILEGASKAKLLEDVVGREQAKEFSERLMATRSFIKAEAETQGVSPAFLDQLEVLSSQAADAGRRLRAFGVDAEDVTIKEKVLQDLIKIGTDAEELVAAGKNVDWNNPKQVTEFYRKFKPASFAERLEEFRYTNMLSSPSTHIVNAFSNLLQGAVAPVEKTITGGLDFVRARLTGTEQKYFASQGVDFANGYFRALPTAWAEAASVFKTGGGLRKPDVDYLPTGTSKLRQIYTFPLTALEASDQFFRQLIIGGETKSLKRAGITGTKAARLAEESADYRTFRQAFDPNGELGQNKVLQIWDKWNSAINSLRRLPGGKWIVPFLQTPTNILKQGVEYSPLGLATVPGSREPMVQLSKTVIGSTVFTAAYALADAGLATFDAPVSEKERSEFYAAGLQPYSVKIGDKWVSYSKLGPLSYPIAMAAAMKWAEENGATNTQMEVAGQGLAGFLRFFSDQSYVRGIGDAIDALRGDEFEQERFFANIPSQLIPYRSFQGWVARLTDPVYRKPDGLMESLASQVPGLSSSLEPYTTPFGEESKRQFPILNAFSPLRVTEEDPTAMEFYNIQREARAEAKLQNKLKKELTDEREKTIRKAGSRADKFAIAYGYDKYLDPKPSDRLEAKQYEAEVLGEARSVFKDDAIPVELKAELITNMGYDPLEVELDAIANSTVLERAIWVREKLKTLPQDQRYAFFRALEEERTLSDKRILTDSVKEELFGTASSGGSGGSGGKSKKIKVPSLTGGVSSQRSGISRIGRVGGSGSLPDLSLSPQSSQVGRIPLQLNPQQLEALRNPQIPEFRAT